jgi:hypothetical protein
MRDVWGNQAQSEENVHMAQLSVDEESIQIPKGDVVEMLTRQYQVFKVATYRKFPSPKDTSSSQCSYHRGTTTRNILHSQWVILRGRTASWEEYYAKIDQIRAHESSQRVQAPHQASKTPVTAQREPPSLSGF